MKKIFCVALAVMVFITTFVVGTARAAEQIVDNNAIVISTNVSVRLEPKTSATRLTSLKNGDTMYVVGTTGEWVIIDASSVGLEPGYAYARKQYILVNPRYIVTNLPETYLWADPWGTGLSVGSKDSGTKMLVLYETAEWYMVQCRESTAGSAFIRKTDIQGGVVSGIPDTDAGNVIFQTGNGAGKYLVNCTTLGVYPTPDDNVNRVAFLHNGDVVEVLEFGDYFTKIKYELKGTPCECYVHSKYLLKVVE